MRKFFALLTAIILFTGCQEQRYFADSPETETLKAAVAAYENGDWDEWRSHFLDTAKIYVNSTEAQSLDDRQSDLADLTSAWENYGFEKEDAYWESVIDKENESWAYYWATHTGKLKGSDKTLRIPVHLAMQIVDGKIAEEHVYFDATQINTIMSELMAAAAAAEAAASEGGEEGDIE